MKGNSVLLSHPRNPRPLGSGILVVFTCAPFSHNALQRGAPMNPPGWNYRPRARVIPGSAQLNLPGRQQSAGKIPPRAWAHASPGGTLRGTLTDFVELSRRRAAEAAWLPPAQWLPSVQVRGPRYLSGCSQRPRRAGRGPCGALASLSASGGRALLFM